MSDQKDNAQVGSLLQINNLDYRMPPSLSVAVSRSHAKYSMNQESIKGGQEMIFVCPTGSHFVDFRNSYIKFTVSVEAEANDNGFGWRGFNNGFLKKTRALTNDDHLSNPGALALFSKMRYIHSSGTPIEEIDDHLDVLMHQKSQWMMGRDWKNTVGSLYDSAADGGVHDRLVAGQNRQRDLWVESHNFISTPQAATAVPQFATNGLEQTFIVPLMLFSDLFAQDKLAPSFLVAGSRLHLKTNSPQKAFVTNDGDTQIQGYTISNASIHLEQYQLTDAIAKVISSISATSGLEYPFESWHYNARVSDQASIQIQVSRALSRANQVMLLTRLLPVADGLQAPGASLTGALRVAPEQRLTYSVKLGGQQIPVQQVDGSKEAYHMALTANRRFYSTAGSDISYEKYKDLGFGALFLSLESSSTWNNPEPPCRRSAFSCST